jgi:hypothetical protein
MSVVNKMLRDLENRDQETQVSADYIAPSKHQKYLRVALLSISLIMVFAGAPTLYFALYSPEDVKPPAEQAPSTDFVRQEGDRLARLSKGSETKSSSLQKITPEASRSSEAERWC